MANPSADIVVIGAGIVGASIAFRLAGRARSVTIVEAGEPGRGATWPSFAWINAREKSPRHYFDLNARALDSWSRFAREIAAADPEPADLGLTWGGEFRWSVSRSGAAELHSSVREMQSWGYPVVELSETEARRLEPGLDLSGYTGGSYSPIEGHVDGRLVVDACLRAAQSAGAKLLTDTRVNRIETDGSGAAGGVVAGDHAIRCDQVIVAAGYDSNFLLGQLGFELPQRQSHGLTSVTTPCPRIFQTVAAVHSPRDLPGSLFNIRQFKDGSVMIHAGTHNGSTDDVSVGGDLIAAAASFIPGLSNVEVAEVRRGMRPMPADGLPAVGPIGRGLYVAVTHSGVTLAPLLSEMIALEVLHGARVDLLDPYRPTRFEGAA